MENEVEKSTNGYEPRVVAFACHYCAYSAADLAGPTGMQYPPNVRIVKMPCTGKLDVLYILDAFENGADAVLVAGCLDGNCHHIEGNLRAKRRVLLAKKILDDLGIGAERLEMYQMSGAESTRFVEAACEMTERARRLGPSPLNALAATAPA